MGPKLPSLVFHMRVKYQPSHLKITAAQTPSKPEVRIRISIPKYI